MDDGQLRSLLAPPPAAAALQAAAVPTSPVLSLRPATRAMLQPALASTLANAAIQPHAAMAEATLVAAPAGTGMHVDLMRQISVLPFAQRTEIQSKLAYLAPTQPVTSTNVTISFDFCVVSLKRRWMHSGFLDNGRWCIPGQPKGRLSANDGRGVPTLPVGFVAIKKLRITAPWTPQDIANLERSTQFGPFNFDSKVVDGAIAHDGIQIVGWMLETLPSLPPN
jgi:hypothetical protein